MKMFDQGKNGIIARIKYVRKSILKIPAQRLAETAGINVNSIRNWERGKIDFLTSISMNNVIKVFESAGVYVSEEWLRTGAGTQPCRYADIKDITILGFEEENMFKNIKRKLGQEVIVVSMLDDSMAPMAYIGDRLGGVIQNNHFEKCNGIDCIVKYDGDRIAVRRLQVQSGVFSLLSLGDKRLIYPQNIVWIAPVCRRWIY